MTYLQFHLLFTLPPLLLLALLFWRGARRGNRFALLVLGFHVLIALVYTTPWDNYLVARGAWGYGAERVLFTLGYVPFEEYLFFVVQTLLTGLFVFTVGRYLAAEPRALSPRTALAVRGGGVLLLLLLAAAGVLALKGARGTYFGLIAVWAAPVLAVQWALGGDLLVQRWKQVALCVGVPTLYLWLADRLALALGIWWVSPELSSGVAVFGLPVEEMLFFLLTNLLVVFGLVLAPLSAALARLQGVRKASPWRLVFALWAVTMIPTPLVPELFPLLAYLSTALLAVGVLGYTLERYGGRAWAIFALSFGFGLLVEWLGHTTGVPFGPYRYTAPGPSLLGVPLLVPLGWFAFSMIALSVSPARLKLPLAPLALVAWDLGLDPLMVSKGFWTFDSGVYYGVPLSNFFGWYVSGFLLVALLLRLEPRLKGEASPALRLVFFAQAFLMTVGLAFFGLFGAALTTLLAMGLVGALSSLSPARSAREQFG